MPPSYTEIITADAGAPSSDHRGKCLYSAPSGDHYNDSHWCRSITYIQHCIKYYNQSVWIIGFDIMYDRIGKFSLYLE